MQNKFVASSFLPLAYPITFGLLALGMVAKGFTEVALILLAVTALIALIFAYNFRMYVITNNEFYTTNLFGGKYDSYLLNDILKAYTLKGYERRSRFGNGGDYATVIFKIQMLSGEIYEIDIDEVFSANDFVNALRQKVEENKYEVQ